MRKLHFYLLSVIMIGACSCTNSSKVSSEEEEFQIDPELKELGELNVKLLEYDDIDVPQNGIVPVKSQGKWGLLTKDGKEILPCLYKEVTYGVDEDVWIVKRNDSIGIVDKKGSFINDLRNNFKSYTCIGNGLLLAVSNDVLEQKFIIPIKYNGFAFLGHMSSVMPISDGVIIAESFGNYKLYSYDGDSLKAITDDYQHFTGEIGEGMCCVTNGWNGKYGFINSKGEIAVPFEFDKPCGPYSDGMATYRDSTEQYGYIDRSGNVVIPAQYQWATNFSDGLAYVSNGDMAGVIDKTGKLIINTFDKYYLSSGFVKGFALVDAGIDGESMGIVNKKGEIVVPMEYSIHNLCDDVYVSCSNDNQKYGVFSYNGKQLVPFEFDELSDFNSGLALAKLGERSFVINKEGKTGILNFEEALAKLNEEAQQPLQEGSLAFDENIKKQLMKIINEENEREVISSPNKIEELTKEDGKYRAFFYDFGEYFTTRYAIRGIIVDKEGVVKDFEIKSVSKTPTDKVKHVEGINAMDQLEYYNQKLKEGNRYNPYK